MEYLEEIKRYQEGFKLDIDDAFEQILEDLRHNPYYINNQKELKEDIVGFMNAYEQLAWED